MAHAHRSRRRLPPFCRTFFAAAEKSAGSAAGSAAHINMEVDDGAVEERKESDGAPSLHAGELAEGSRSDFPLQAADSQLHISQ